MTTSIKEIVVHGLLGVMILLSSDARKFCLKFVNRTVKMLIETYNFNVFKGCKLVRI